MSSEVTFNKIVNYILLAIPLAMGIVALVLSVISTVQSTPTPDMTLPLGLGMACLAIFNLDFLETSNEG